MTQTTPDGALKQIAWPLRLTLLGLWAEALTRALWPLWSVLILGLGLGRVRPVRRGSAARHLEAPLLCGFGRVVADPALAVAGAVPGQSEEAQWRHKT